MLVDNPRYSLSLAVLVDGVTERYVIADRDDELHVASLWLAQMADVSRSPNTIRDYGRRVAWYLSWTVLTADWRSVRLSHLVLWRRVLSTSPIVKANGELEPRSEKTTALWMTSVRSFYEWADTEGLLRTDLVSKMTQVKYFAPGTRSGGEHGTKKRVLVDSLRPVGYPVAKLPQWIDDPEARRKLEELTLNARDRFLVDLLYFTGIRVGEALSLFRSDIHFSGRSRDTNCTTSHPHFHVMLDNPVENGARAKGRERLLHAAPHLVERYIDYLLERERLLSAADKSPHVFVNLYSDDKWVGRAMTGSNVRRVIDRCSQRIGFALTGPHMLRHTFATRLVRGIDCEAQSLDVVQEILGHTSIDSTRVYTHELEPATRAALNALPTRTVVLGSKSA
jgi:site-specific recombinase XerD